MPQTVPSAVAGQRGWGGVPQHTICDVLLGLRTLLKRSRLVYPEAAAARQTECVVCVHGLQSVRSRCCWACLPFPHSDHQIGHSQHRSQLPPECSWAEGPCDKNKSGFCANQALKTARGGQLPPRLQDKEMLGFATRGRGGLTSGIPPADRSGAAALGVHKPRGYDGLRVAEPRFPASESLVWVLRNKNPGPTGSTKAPRQWLPEFWECMRTLRYPLRTASGQHTGLRPVGDAPQGILGGVWRHVWLSQLGHALALGRQTSQCVGWPLP